MLTHLEASLLKGILDSTVTHCNIRIVFIPWLCLSTRSGDTALRDFQQLEKFSIDISIKGGSHTRLGSSLSELGETNAEVEKSAAAPDSPTLYL